ncbi:MAG: hypothetical protein GY792_00440 [Gammaproteobacteria bacterium]|nr:hypothetical protein [Gammaproteobacteria bacterium]
MPLKLILPFVVMCLVTLITPRNDKSALDRFYAKMRTPVQFGPEEDQRQLQLAYENPAELDRHKLFPGTDLEITKPTLTDILGFIVCLGICFAFVRFAVWITSIGASG